MQLLSHLLTLSTTSDFREQAILFHNPKDSFGIVTDAFAVSQPLPHSTISVGMKTFLLLPSYLLCHLRVFLRPVKPMHKTVISASGHRKEVIHDGYWILFSMAIDDHVLYFRSHLLPGIAENLAAIRSPSPNACFHMPALQQCLSLLYLFWVFPLDGE